MEGKNGSTYVSQGRNVRIPCRFRDCFSFSEVVFFGYEGLYRFPLKENILQQIRYSDSKIKLSASESHFSRNKHALKVKQS